MDTSTPWAGTDRPAYPIGDHMRARTATDQPENVRRTDDTPEPETDAQGVPSGPENDDQPEPDSHDDLVRRVARLEEILR